MTHFPVDQHIFDVSPDWPIDWRFDEITEQLDEAMSRAEQRWTAELERLGPPGNYEPGEMPADELSEIGSLADTIRLAFFLIAVAHFDRVSKQLRARLERAAKIPVEAEGKPGDPEWVMSYFALHPATAGSTLNLERLQQVRQLRNEAAHGGGDLSKQGRKKCKPLIDAGDVRISGWGTISLDEDFSRGVSAELKAQYVAWAVAIRAFEAEDA